MRFNPFIHTRSLGILSGGILSISWITEGYPLLLFFGFVPILWVSYKTQQNQIKNPNWKLFSSTYLCFFIFNIGTTWWLYYASIFGMWFAVLVNSLLMSLVFFAYHIIARKGNFIQSSICLISLWVCFEKFHMNWDFSWPWLNLGNGFASHHKWVQWYEYTGTFGGTIWILTCNLIFFKALKNGVESKNKRAFFRGTILGISLIILGIYSSLYMYHNTDIKAQKKVNVLVLQPNINPYTQKYNRTNLATATDLVTLAQSKMDDNVQFIIAPETTLSQPEYIKYFTYSSAHQCLKNFIKIYPKSSFLCGVAFSEKFNKNIPKNPTANTYKNSKDWWYNSFNSAFLINNNDKFQYYHKSKLVVGVEHIPYRTFFEPLMGYSTLDLGGSLVTLTPQKERTIFKHQNTKAAPIICYESVYGSYVIEYIQKGAEFLIIITNDGWWENSQGHKQHLELAKLRAIETRKVIVRCANTGISAIINTQGDIEKYLEYDTKGSIKTNITTNHHLTFYVKHGDYLFNISLLLLLLIIPVLFLNHKFSIYKN